MYIRSMVGRSIVDVCNLCALLKVNMLAKVGYTGYRPVTRKGGLVCGEKALGSEIGSRPDIFGVPTTLP